MIKEYFYLLKQELSDFRWSSNRAINSFKTAIACLIGYLIVIFSPLPQPQWIVITILVVMSAQSTMGGMLIKSHMRFWGTLAGGLISVTALFLVGNDVWGVALVLLASTLLFSYIAGSSGDMSAAGVLGGVTVVMILLSQKATVLMAGERIFEIILGIIIAFLVSKFIFPISAHTTLLRSFADTIKDLKIHFNRCLDDDSDSLTFSNLDLDEKISKAFPGQRKLIHEIAFEPGKHSREVVPLQKMLNSLVKVYRFINMLYYSEHSSEKSVNTIKAFVGLDVFQQRVSDFLLQIAASLRSEKKGLNLITGEFEHYMKNDFAEMVQQNKHEQIAAINAFLFAARLLTQQLIILAEMVEEISMNGVKS